MEAALGEGRIGSLLARLSLPAIVAQLVNLLYNLVDRVFIGHIPETGDLALTGLGLCFPVIMMMTAFTNLIGAGGAPRAAIYLGKERRDEAEKILGACAAALVLTAAALAVALEITGARILRLFGASGRTLPYALSYLRVYALGAVPAALSLGLNAFITAQGFSKTAMKTVMIGAGLNLALDPLFIFRLGMGVSGAALATVLAQSVSAAWALLFLTGGTTVLKIRVRNLRIERDVILPVLALGVSPFVMSATESLLNVAFNSSLARYGGDAAVGAVTIAASVMQLQFMPAQGLTQGAQPVISYNYGAGKTARVRKTYRLLIAVCLAYTTAFCLAAEAFPGAFVRLFSSGSGDLTETAVRALRIYMAATGVFGVQSAVQSTFLALGQAKVSLFIACLRKLILLIPLIYILPLFFQDKVFAVFLAEPAADFISVTAAATLFALNINKILAKPALG